MLEQDPFVPDKFSKDHLLGEFIAHHHALTSLIALRVRGRLYM